MPLRVRLRGRLLALSIAVGLVLPATASGDVQLHGLVAAPLAPDVLVATVGDVSPGTTYVIRSADSGRTWTRVPASPDPTVPFLLLGTGQTMLGSNRTGLLRSTDGGSTWSATSLPKPAGERFAFVADPTHADWAWRCSDGGLDGIARTSDAGVSWTSLRTPGTAGCNGLAVQPAESPVLLYVDASSSTSRRTYFQRSTDGGGTWVRFQFPGWGFSAPTFDPERPNVVLLMQRDTNSTPGSAFLWRSTDAGAHWTQVIRALPTQKRNGRVVAKFDLDSEARLAAGAGRFVVGPLLRTDAPTSGTRGNVYLSSSDHGRTWRYLSGPHPRGSRSVDASGLLPVTGFGVATSSTVLATESGRAGGVFPLWRFDRGSSHWVEQPIDVSATQAAPRR